MAKQKLSCEENLIQVQEEILSITKAVADCGDRISSEISTRFNKVDDDFQKLKQQYDEVDKITHLNAIKIVDLHLKTLHALMERKSQEVSDIDIANEIRNRNFKKAVALMRNRKQLPSKIVNEVYAGKQENTDIILDFATFVSSTQPNIAEPVLKALKFEMRANNHRNPYKIIKLYQTLQKDVVNHVLCSPTIKGWVEQGLEEIESDIVEVVTETFQSAMYSKNYQRNVDVEKLAIALETFNSDVYDKVMQGVVKAVYTKIPSVEIAENIYSNENISPKVVGLVALFEELKRDCDLNNKAVLSIGYYLNCLSNLEDYSKISEKKQKAVKEVIHAMPICAKNLLFEDTICIWNKYFKGYLYAASDRYKYDADRRRIFTWYKNERVLQGAWITKKNHDLFTFKNVKHKEYMYASEVVKNNTRYVLTWVKGGMVGEPINEVHDQSAWNIELCGDYCYIRNKAYNEYLYAFDKEYDKERRSVFTGIKGSSSSLDQFMWQIRSK